MSHTPGSWKAEKRGTTEIKYFVVEKTSEEDWGIVINIPEPPFAFGAVGALVCTANLSDEEAMQRAHLIAAAPELLEALKEAHRIIRESDLWWMDCPDKGGFDEVAINAVIAKAEGRAGN